MSELKPHNAGVPYYVPPEPSRLPSFLLAVVVHAALLAFLWIGVSWTAKTPITVEAEVWDMSVQTAAAPELPPEPAPEVTPEPEPAPEPEPVRTPPSPTPPPVVEQPAPKPAPDIALQREKERKAEDAKKKELAEKREAEKREREEQLAEQKKKDEAERKQKELAAKKEADAEKKKKEAEKLAEEKKKDAEDKKKADALAAADKKKADAAKAKAAAAENAKLDKFRADELKRMAGAMGSTGSAAKSTGPKSDGGYIAAITAAIKSSTAYPGNTDVSGNPRATFRVDQLPTGEIMSVRLVKSSGVPEFDRAVENGIKKASPLPKKKDGTVERTLDVNFSMRDYD
ncbi:cell envelope integrity protein TolA [Massilia aurea]|uniref:cell envelope integrity protein TolA n=1 Tax=Massilia aurea TaxID=373040 RepID=UPI0034627BEE